MIRKEREEFIQNGKKVIAIESAMVEALLPRIEEKFADACTYLSSCKGRVILVGMGKSGHVGKKIAATLASTGTPSLFVHPGEASHGDLGMIVSGDVVIALSNSGETSEVLTILPLIKRLGVPLITLCGNPESTLGKLSDVCLNVGVEMEACPHDLAPTASTTATLVMGDALAVAVFQSKGFSKEDFARSHPGGALGRRKLVYVRDIMRFDQEVPTVPADTLLPEALEIISKGKIGMVGIVDQSDCLIGVFTDGDLRRSHTNRLAKDDCRIGEIMTTDPIVVSPDILAAEVAELLQENLISCVLVTDDDNHVIGALHTHDLLRSGVL